MPGKSFIMNLAKLLIAAAWADGELSNDEVNALKDLLFLVPEMTGQDWLELELYMDSPVNPQERDRLLRNVLDEVRSAKDKRLVVETLKKLIEVDGIVSEEEAAVLEQVQQDVEGSPTGLLSHLAKAMRERSASGASTLEPEPPGKTGSTTSSKTAFTTSWSLNGSKRVRA